MIMHVQSHDTGISLKGRGRLWTVRMIGRMLAIETLLLFLLGLFHLLTGDAVDFPPASFLWILDRLSIGYSLPLCIMYWLLCVWAAVATALFIRLSSSAWLHAVSLQSALLAIMIARYYLAKPAYGYVMMIYAAWLVVYLHYSEVETVFHASPPPERTAT